MRENALAPSSLGAARRALVRSPSPSPNPTTTTTTTTRSAAKNNAAVTVAVSPAQYPELLAELAANDGCTSSALRRRFAAEAFAHTAAYDAAIAGWFAAQVAPAAAAAASSAPPPTVVRAYTRELALKYGCNPHQAPAFCGAIVRAPAALAGGGGAQAAVPGEMPFRVLNGAPGYINLLDACNAYQLAAELFAATGLAGAASFKHVSPAGAAVAVPLPPALADVYDCAGAALTPVALAYLRARSADPLCSYGDFAAVSHVVDEATAAILKPEVSDGIVAPGYTPAALDILRAKKGGAFVILEAKPGFAPPADEYREVYGVFARSRVWLRGGGLAAHPPPPLAAPRRARTPPPFSGMAFAQRRNDAPVTAASVSGDSVVTAAPGGGGGRGTMPPDAVRDLLVALVSIKYTQSNSVGYALGGQMVGVGAGQQSRVDCVKLAGRKVATWWLRQHPAVLALDFKPDVKRQAKVNARVRYIEGDMTAIERGDWLLNFGAEPPPLTDGDKAAWLAKLSGVALASDAFFPFRDSLDHAAKYGVQFVAQPGGSVQDAEVTKAAEAYGMTMAHNKLRLFHH